MALFLQFWLEEELENSKAPFGLSAAEMFGGGERVRGGRGSSNSETRRRILYIGGGQEVCQRPSRIPAICLLVQRQYLCCGHLWGASCNSLFLGYPSQGSLSLSLSLSLSDDLHVCNTSLTVMRPRRKTKLFKRAVRFFFCVFWDKWVKAQPTPKHLTDRQFLRQTMKEGEEKKKTVKKCHQVNYVRL
jgi:hypothetical protein